jgi:hypothetical protein
MSVLRRSRIRLVSDFLTLRLGHLLNFLSDCPEREAIYIITNGGINDPDKV